MRRPQSFGRSAAYGPLSDGVADYLREGRQSFGGIRLPPKFTWGVSFYFSSGDSYSSMGQGQFLDGRMVVAGGQKVISGQDQSLPTDDAFVISADGLTPTPLPALPDAGTNRTISATLGDGRILFCGGTSGNKSRTLHPGTLLWTVRPDMEVGLGGSYTLTTLANGDVLRVGGLDTLDNVLSSVQQYVQGSNTWVSKAPLGTPRAGHTAVLLADGRVLVMGGGASGELYDPIGNSWSPISGDPQAGNRAHCLVTTAAGVTYAADSNNAFVLYMDRFDPVTNAFVPLATYSPSWQSVGSGLDSQRIFDIGDGLLCMILVGFYPRESYYDIRRDSWFERDPGYPEPLPATNCLFHITKNTFFALGGAPNSTGTRFYAPHNLGRYAILSTLPRNDGVKPSFAGLVDVVEGTDPTRAFLTWSPGSDARTYVEDLNYFVYPATVSGGQVYGPVGTEYANTTAWAGSKSIELFNLTPDTDYFFVVRARDLSAEETFLNEGTEPGNFDTNVVEVAFTTPLTGSAPTWNWTPTASMGQSRRNLQGMKVGRSISGTNCDVSRYLVFGGTTDDTPPTTGDIYDNDGQAVLPVSAFTADLTDAAVVHSDALIHDGTQNRLGAVLGGLQGLFVRSDQSPRFDPYSNTTEGVDTNHSGTPAMNEAVNEAAAAGIEVNDLLRIGGVTDIDVTDTVERLFYLECQKVTFTAGVSDFTVGAVLTGLTSGATGTIEKIDVFGPGSGQLIVSNVTGGFFFASEELTDSLGGDAFAQFFSSGPYFFEKWVFVASMSHKRRGHSAIEMADGRVLVAGGTDELGSPVTDVEIYDPATDTWDVLPGAQDHSSKPALVRLAGSNDILIIGGDTNFGGGSFVDLVDAAGTTVTAKTNLPGSRKRHTAHRFADGSVGVFGGDVDGTPSNDCRLYDPVGNTWSHPAGIDMGTNRAGHVSFLLPNNTVLVVGGEDDTFAALASAEISGP